MTEIPESLYFPYLNDSRTYMTTYTVDAGKPTEHEYDALIIDVPDLLDAIAATGVPVACPECKALASLSIPVKDVKAWDVSASHRAECSEAKARPQLRVLDTRAGAEPHGES